jgi:hypothetical protein
MCLELFLIRIIMISKRKNEVNSIRCNFSQFNFFECTFCVKIVSHLGMGMVDFDIFATIFVVCVSKVGAEGG